MNKEGIEKIVNIQNKFEEVEFNVIPIYNNLEIKNPLNHFYKNRKGLLISQVMERLQRKY